MYIQNTSMRIVGYDATFEARASTGMVLPQEQVDKNEAPSLQSTVPPRQEQEGSAEASARASHGRDPLAILSIKGHPHQISGLRLPRQELLCRSSHQGSLSETNTKRFYRRTCLGLICRGSTCRHHYSGSSNRSLAWKAKNKKHPC